jgi:glutathione gamma-glutamylcysteinyltransferase
MSTHHRRPLPPGTPAFTSPEGRDLLRAALAAGTAEAFFPLISQLHTQAEPAWCGLGTLITVLNALEIDPGRPWRGPWRHYGEELLTCCKSLDAQRAEGLTLDELVCLAACNGANGPVRRPDAAPIDRFRDDLRAACAAPAGVAMVVAYSRGALGQTGDGHFSPIGAWEPASDRALVLDVARFKYPPHWVSVGALYEATRSPDPATGRPRGWVVLRRSEAFTGDRAQALALGEQLAALACCPLPLPPAEG